MAASELLSGDEFFTTEQIARLTDLMTQWRASRDVAESLPPAVQAELDALITAELAAAIVRSSARLSEERAGNGV